MVEILLRGKFLVAVKHRSCPLPNRWWVSVTNAVEERISVGDFMAQAHRTRSNTRSRINTKIKTAMQQLDHLSCELC